MFLAEKELKSANLFQNETKCETSFETAVYPRRTVLFDELQKVENKL